MTKTMYVLTRDDAVMGVFSTARKAYAAMLNYFSGPDWQLDKVAPAVCDDLYYWIYKETGEVVEVDIEEFVVDDETLLPPDRYQITN